MTAPQLAHLQCTAKAFFIFILRHTLILSSLVPYSPLLWFCNGLFHPCSSAPNNTGAKKESTRSEAEKDQECMTTFKLSGQNQEIHKHNKKE